MDLRNDEDTIEGLKFLQSGPVKTIDGRVMAEKIGAVEYLECSAKTRIGVQQVFTAAAKHALRQKKHKRKSKLLKFFQTC